MPQNSFLNARTGRIRSNKNEIIVFARKVQDVRASKGFFVARRFAKDAIAQAKRDGIELLTADDVIDVLPSFLNDFCIRGNSFIASDTVAKFFVITSDPQKEGFLPGYNFESFVRYGSEDLLLGKLIDKLANEIVNEYTNQLPPSTPDQEKSRYESTKIFSFSLGELFIEGFECYAIELHVVWETRLIRPVITSKFDIKTRGRVITVATDDSPLGGSIQISFISTE